MKPYDELIPEVAIIKQLILEQNKNETIDEFNELKHLYIEFAHITEMLKCPLSAALWKS